MQKLDASAPARRPIPIAKCSIGDDAFVLFRTARGEWYTYESSRLLAAFINTLGVLPGNRLGPDDFDLVKEKEGSQLSTKSSFSSRSSSSSSSLYAGLPEETFSSAGQENFASSSAQQPSMPHTPLLQASSDILPSLESPLFLDSDSERPITPTRELGDRWSPSSSVSTPTTISPRQLEGRISRSEPPSRPAEDRALKIRSPKAIRRRATTRKLPVRLQKLDYFK
ncbi:hypothetical protein PG994_003367 [Apiospora phragmitis]|uniref:Uncharacterized protein n=1 Tax=Apiospora phragmitis TaxID=2905665 RepID=A0ABR1VXW6_9PEZI